MAQGAFIDANQRRLSQYTIANKMFEKFYGKFTIEGSPADEMETFIVKEIAKLFNDNNINARISGNTIHIKSKWNNNKVNVHIDFSTGAAHISRSYGILTVGDDALQSQGRKVLLHDPDCFEKMQAIVNHLMC